MNNEQIEYLLKTPYTKPVLKFTHNLNDTRYTILLLSIEGEGIPDIVLVHKYFYNANTIQHNFHYIKLIWDSFDKKDKQRITNWFAMLAKHNIKVNLDSLPTELAALFILS